MSWYFIYLYTLVPRQKQRDHKPKLPVTAEQYHLLYEVSKDDWCGIIIPLLFDTGMRKEEILGLDWSDVKDGYISVNKAYASTKGGIVVLSWKNLRPKEVKDKYQYPLPLRKPWWNTRQCRWEIKTLLSLSRGLMLEYLPQALTGSGKSTKKRLV